MRRSLKVKLSLIGAVLAAGAMADDIKANKGKADASFFEEAFVGGEAEVRLSQLALRQSSDPAVKQLAQQMIDDHTKANDALRQVAESKGFVLPPSMIGASGSIGGSGSSATGSTGSATNDQGTVTGERMGAGDNRMGSGSTGSTGSTGSIGSGSAGSNTGSDTTGSGSVGSGSTGSDTAGSGAGQAGTGSSGSTGSATGSDTTGSGSMGSTGSGSAGSRGSTGSMGSSGSGSTYGSRQGGSGSTGSGSVGSGSTGSGAVGSMAGLTSTQRQMMKKYDEISKKTGAEFDKAYLTQLIDDHKKDVRLYEKESKSGTDSELKTWATNTLPTLRHHLEMVQTIEKDVRGRRSNTM